MTMAHHHIRITNSMPNKAHPDKSALELSDSGITRVNPGDHVTWIIDAKEITSILVKDDNIHVNLFEPDPHPVAPEKKDSEWTGTVQQKLQKGAEESYTICWTQAGETYCFDPKIQVNP
jgi:plastocyanin